jgi:hypothetical protein
MSVTTWTRTPGTHFKASRFQFVSVDDGATMTVGVKRAAFFERAERTMIVFPVPGALAISDRKPCFVRVSTSSF